MNGIVKKRISNIDYLKALAIFLVIFVHTQICTSNEEIIYKLGGTFFIGRPVSIFMIISGFTFSISLSKFAHNKDILGYYYARKNILNKLRRFIIPVIPIYLVRVLKNVLIDKESFDFIKFLLKFFILGGEGPGTYYFPCMLQLTLIFPLIYMLIKKCKCGGLGISLVIQIAWEIFCTTINMDSQVHRNLFLRYIFHVAIGCFIYLYGNKINYYHLMFAFVVGGVGLLNYTYCGWKAEPWVCDTIIVALWSAPFLKLALVDCSNYKMRFPKIGKMMELIGKSSYHIFLIQILWFVSNAESIVDEAINATVGCVSSIAVCMFAGVAFYQVETKIRRKNLSLGETNSV